jgi:hypothetical protein
MSRNGNPNDIYPANPDDAYYCSEAEYQIYVKKFQLQQRWQ